MGVKVRKMRGSYYLVIDHKGQRKTKKVGGTREFANDVARKVEAKLTLGDLGILSGEKSSAPLFSEYAERWLQQHVGIYKKPATIRVYTSVMENHILPQFGNKRLDAIGGDTIEDFIYSLAKKKDEAGGTVYTQKTISLIFAVLKSFLAYAKQKKQIAFNPASDLGEIAKSDKSARVVESMTRQESEDFLCGVQETNPRMYPFFLCAIRTGMRRGELIGLKWSDISFGAGETSDRYIMVSRTYSAQGYGTPKSGKSRRVDMSKQLRAVLLEVRDERMLAAIQTGKQSIADDLVFPNEQGKPLHPEWLSATYMKPALAFAGMRHFHPHSLRHTFAVLAIQSGAPLKYVSDQLGHSSINITANTYGHLQPGANAYLMDRLDSETQTDANQPQTRSKRDRVNPTQDVEPYMVSGTGKGDVVLIDCYRTGVENNNFTGAESAESGKTRQNPQTSRKR